MKRAIYTLLLVASVGFLAGYFTPRQSAIGTKRKINLVITPPSSGRLSPSSYGRSELIALFLQLKQLMGDPFDYCF
ncbi:MAG: hypothetical protein Q8L71_03905 [Thiobacillus sp.]|nr:hypothetical protein [Thiobacillus sp.]